jgi:TPP-dependent pyruvate/acetoin dehydrogenase alpha subunit
MKDNLTLYRTILLIRRFEERLLAEFSSGKLVGTTHVYIGEEADAVGIFSATERGDVVFSNHRCHGHFLAYGASQPGGSDPYHLAAELMGKATGMVGGRGGSQHIHWNNFYSNGVQGGILPVATGMALAEKEKKSGQVVLVFFGDGTLGEGALYESLNIASLWKLPILFVVENNRYAQTTPIHLGVSGTIKGRFDAFGISTWEKETMDVLEINALAEQALGHIRRGNGPAGLILHTQRFSAHSKGDDPRSTEELTRIRQQDPLVIQSARLSEAQISQAEADIASLIDDAFTRACADPFPRLEQADVVSAPASISNLSN